MELDPFLLGTEWQRVTGCSLPQKGLQFNIRKETTDGYRQMGESKDTIKDYGTSYWAVMAGVWQPVSHRGFLQALWLKDMGVP